MSTDYYTATGKPSSHGTGSSNEMRSEFASIEGGFAKLPALTGNNSKVVFVNANGTGMESKTAAQTLTAINGLSAALLPNVSTTVNASSAELNNVVGVTSAIQTQLNAKAATVSPTFSGTVTAPTLTSTTATITTLNSVTSINGGQLGGLRNRIINGACDIAQRGTSIAVPVSTVTYGGPDRYCTVNNVAGGQFTQSQSTLTYNGVVKNTVRQTVDTATTSFSGTNYWAGIFQAIEGYNCYDLINQPITISFIFNTNLTGTYSARLSDHAAARSYVTTFTATANTPTKITVNIPAYASLVINRDNTDGLSLNIGFLNQGTYQTGTLNTWQVGNWLSATGATNWAATAGNFIELTELQLEAGSVATTFERRPIALELALCQRYYQKNSAAWGQAITSTVISTMFTLITPMRVSPITILDNGTSLLTRIGGSGENVTSVSSAFVSGTTMMGLNLAGTGYTVNSHYAIINTGISFSAEFS